MLTKDYHYTVGSHLPPLMYTMLSSVRSGRIKLCSLANSANEMTLYDRGKIDHEVWDHFLLALNQGLVQGQHLTSPALHLFP